MTVELHQGDCLGVMAGMEAGSVDLTVTSPPYDNLRTYNGYVFDFEGIARELYRVTKEGGVVVWVVADATINGSETGTSFRQALYFKDECGFNLHDTMIYQVAGTGAKGSHYCYWQAFEYMFVLSKGRPHTVNRIKDHRNRWGGTRASSSYADTRKTTAGRVMPRFSVRTNVWEYSPGNKGDDYTGHPAPFPEALARDHIISWSNPGDVVLDPMMGSGTTGKMAILNDRRFIGIDISAEYIEIARARIEMAQLAASQMRLEL